MIRNKKYTSLNSKRGIMKVRFYKIFFLLMIISFSCVESFNPELEGYDNLLVVDGYFTDEEKSHQIKLYFTSDVYSAEFQPVLWADVKVISDEGDIIQFYEENNYSGIYFSDENVKAEAGKKYKLSVQINNFLHYETDFQELITSPPIDAVYGERETRPTWEVGEELDGLQFFLDTRKTSDKSVYFQWRLTETYEYDAAFTLDAIAYGPGVIIDVYNNDSTYTCWKTTEIPVIFTHSIQYSGNKAIKKIPLLYVGNNTKQLSKRYSLNVKQYALNKGAYNYWSAIKKLIDNQGTLYSIQPYQVQGNLKNINNPDEVVLGYFVVAGATEKRIFIDRPSGMDVKNDDCTLDTYTLNHLEDVPSARFPLYLSSSTGRLGVVNVDCLDCQLEGGILTKPDFWK